MVEHNLHREETLEMSSDKTFGLVFFAVFALIGLLPLFHGGPIRIWSLIVGAAFLLAALFAPRSIRPLNRLWMRLGALLHHIVSPVALAVVFYLTVAPIGLGMRLFGKDPLKLSFDKNRTSYWEPRHPPGPDPESMRNQF